MDTSERLCELVVPLLYSNGAGGGAFAVEEIEDSTVGSTVLHWLVTTGGFD